MVLNNSLLVLFFYAISQAIRLGSNVFLAKVLAPEQFGVMAIMLAIIAGIQMISDIGLDKSVIRSKNSIKNDFLNTVWSLQIIKGILLFLLLIGLSDYFSSFYEEDLTIYLISLSSILIINGLSPVSFNKALKVGNIKPVIVIELISQLLAVSIMLLTSLVLKNVWPLIIGAILNPFFKVIMGFVFFKEFYKFRVKKKYLSEVFTFGKWIFLSTFLGFIANQYDRLAIAKLTNLEEAGVYNIAVIFTSVSIQVFSMITSKVLFPYYTKEKARRIEKEGLVLIDKIKIYFLAFSLIVLILFLILSDSLISFLYDRRYFDAIEIIKYLSLVNAFTILVGLYDNKMLADGYTKSFALLVFFKVVTIVTFSTYGFVNFGIDGFMLGYIISALSTYVFCQVIIVINKIRLRLIEDVVYISSCITMFYLLGPSL